MKPTHLLKTNTGEEFWVWRNFGEDYYTHENGKVYVGGINSLTPIIKSTLEPQEETFDWKTAMKLFADGVEVEAFVGSSWMSFPYSLHPDLIGFDKTMKYRRKAVAPKPDYSKDQGFVPDDFIMVGDGDSWEFGRYYGFNDGCEYHHIAWVTRHDRVEFKYNFKYARPLTKSEYERVKVSE